VLVEFGGAKGVKPAGTLTWGDDGALYGFTAGDQTTAGTAFRMTADGTFTTLASLPGGPGTGPIGLAASGAGLYGMTKLGGTYGLGQVWQMDEAGAVTTIASFAPYGISPAGPLAKDAQGNFYGATSQSGPDLYQGMVYKLSADGVFTPLALLPASVGAAPLGGVTFGADGALYGTTSTGGANQGGAVFRVTLDGTVSLVDSFQQYVTGSAPANPLTLAADGNLYGTNPSAIFKVANGKISTVASFDNYFGDGIGTLPHGALTTGPDGALYGVTSDGGPRSNGTIFRLPLQGSVSAVASFGYPPGYTGAPSGQLALGPDGALYGPTFGGNILRWAAGGTQSYLPTNVAPSTGLLFRAGRIYTVAQNSLSQLAVTSISIPSYHEAPLASLPLPEGTAGGSSALVPSDSGYLYGVEYADGYGGQGCLFRALPPANRIPVAVDDRYPVQAGTMSLTVLDNDTDADADQLTITSVSGASQGNVVINPDGTLGYTAQAGFAGSDTITYTIEDGYGGSATAQVEIYDTPPGTSQVALYAHAKQSVTADLLKSASDPDPGQTLIVSALGVPAHGRAVLAGSTVTYTAGADFTGADQFSYTVDDGFGGVSTGLVLVRNVPALLAGNYAGTVADDFMDYEYDVDPDYLKGPIRLTVSRTGAFTGTLLFGAHVHGVFGVDGHYKGSVAILGERYTVDLQLDPDTHTLTGTMIDRFGEQLDLSAGEERYSAKNPAPQAGRYTFAVEGGEIFTQTAAVYHFGDGFGVMTISSTGSVRLSGILGDGAPWSAGAPFYGSGSCSFQAATSYPGYDPGEVHGDLAFGNGTASDAAGEIHWSRTIHKPFQYISINQPGYDVFQKLTVSRLTVGQSLADILETGQAVVGYTGGPLNGASELLNPLGDSALRRAASSGWPVQISYNPRNGLFSGTTVSPGVNQHLLGGVFLPTQHLGFGCYSFPGGHGAVGIIPNALAPQ
jgi:uncharacterized repeat protein (TIGR03803 family)